MSLERSTANRTEVGPLQASTPGPLQTSTPNSAGPAGRDDCVSSNAVATRPGLGDALSALSRVLLPPAEMLVIDRRRDLPALLDPVGWSSPIARRKVA
jgi:hypothetical protein